MFTLCIACCGAVRHGAYVLVSGGRKLDVVGRPVDASQCVHVTCAVAHQ
jgi:hypothetical protein